MIERHNNTNVDLEKLFEVFYTMITEARSVPFTEKIMLDEDDLVNLIEDLKNAIPREIKSATQVLEEQKNIVNKAYADADRIVQQAKNEAERIIGVAQAEADAKIRQEEVVKQDSLQYADDMLGYLGENLQSALQGLQDNTQNIAKEVHKVQYGESVEAPEDEATEA